MADDEVRQEDANSSTNSEDLIASFEVPAMFANKFYVTLTPSGARIAFAEILPTERLKFRNAVMLGFHDAVALSKLLDKMIKENVVFPDEPPREDNEASQHE